MKKNKKKLSFEERILLGAFILLLIPFSPIILILYLIGRFAEWILKLKQKEVLK